MSNRHWSVVINDLGQKQIVDDFDQRIVAILGNAITMEEAHILAAAPLIFDAIRMVDHSMQEWKELEKLEAKALGQGLLTRMLEDAK